MYREYTDAFTRRQPGNLAVRLFRDRAMTNKYFVHSWWTDRARHRLAEASDTYAEMGRRLGALLIERRATWELKAIDTDARPPRPARRDEVLSRIVKVVVHPGQSSRMIDRYHEVTQGFTRRQPGCLAVQLFEDATVDNVYFLQSYWRTADDFHRTRATPELQAIWTGAYPFLEQRLEHWDLDCLDDDPRRPVFAAPGPAGP